jgi:hypothetical protein
VISHHDPQEHEMQNARPARPANITDDVFAQMQTVVFYQLETVQVAADSWMAEFRMNDQENAENNLWEMTADLGEEDAGAVVTWLHAEFRARRADQLGIDLTTYVDEFATA